MTRALPRTSLYSSSLVRFLTENALFTPARHTVDVGQKLGDWLDFRQAIALHGVIHPEPAHLPKLAPKLPPAARMAPGDVQALARHVDKVRAQLAESIAQGAPAGSGLARIDMPAAVLDEPLDPKNAFEPYRRFVAAHQRQMESSLRSLRAQLRLRLGQSGIAGQQLAALDAAFENILAEREALLLAKTAKLLEKHFAQALKLHIQAAKKGPARPPSSDLAAETADGLTGKADAAAASVIPQADPSSWLKPLQDDLRQALLAELETRLQPALGLLEALTIENPSAP